MKERTIVYEQTQYGVRVWVFNTNNDLVAKRFFSEPHASPSQIANFFYVIGVRRNDYEQENAITLEW